MSNIQNQELFADLNTEESDELNGGFRRRVCRWVTVWKKVRIGYFYFWKRVTVWRCYYA